MIKLATLQSMFQTFEQEAFRLEKREIYKIDDEWKLYQKFIQGQHVLEIPSEKEFRDLIASDTKKGKVHKRVRVVPAELNDYIKFEIKLAYLKQIKIGHKIYFIEKPEFSKLIPSNFHPGDFYLFDDKNVIKLNYTPQGEFVGTESIEDKNSLEKYIELKKQLLKKVVPLEKWLSIKNIKL